MRRGRSWVPGTEASPSPISTARSSSTAASSAWSSLWRRVYEEREIRQIVGVPEATAVEIAMLRIPGGERRGRAARVQGLRAEVRQRTAVRLRDRSLLRLRARYRGVSCRARRAGRRVPLRRAGRDAGGPNAGGKSLYALDPDGYIFEFHQRPPDAPDATTSRPAGRTAAAGRAVPADAADPLLRGPRRRALPAGRDLRHRAQLRRAGGDRRRRRGRHARRPTTSSATTARTGT